MKNPLKPFDLNSDGFIDMEDMVMVFGAFGSKKGEPRYKERLDFDGDGEIGQREANIMAALFGVRIRDDD